MSIKNTFLLLVCLSTFAISCKKNDTVSQPDLVFNDTTDTVSKVNIVNKYATKLNIDIYANVPGAFFLYNFHTHFEVPANDTIQLPTRLFSSLSHDQLADIKVDCYSDDYTVSNWPELSTYAYSVEGPKLAHKGMDFYISGVASGNRRLSVFKNGKDTTKWVALDAYTGQYRDTGNMTTGSSIWSTLSAAEKDINVTCYPYGLYRIGTVNAGAMTEAFCTQYQNTAGLMENGLVLTLTDTTNLSGNSDYRFCSNFSAGARRMTGSKDTAMLNIGNRVYVMVKQ